MNLPNERLEFVEAWTGYQVGQLDMQHRLRADLYGETATGLDAETTAHFRRYLSQYYHGVLEDPYTALSLPMLGVSVYPQELIDAKKIAMLKIGYDIDDALALKALNAELKAKCDFADFDKMQETRGFWDVYTEAVKRARKLDITPAELVEDTARLSDLQRELVELGPFLEFTLKELRYTSFEAVLKGNVAFEETVAANAPHSGLAFEPDFDLMKAELDELAVKSAVGSEAFKFLKFLEGARIYGAVAIEAFTNTTNPDLQLGVPIAEMPTVQERLSFLETIFGPEYFGR